MTNRERALTLAAAAIECVEAAGIEADTPDKMSYALVLVLADIAERLDEITKAVSHFGPE